MLLGRLLCRFTDGRWNGRLAIGETASALREVWPHVVIGKPAHPEEGIAGLEYSGPGNRTLQFERILQDRETGLRPWWIRLSGRDIPCIRVAMVPPHDHAPRSSGSSG